MASDCNNRERTPTSERLLTAARECVLAVGWKRTTLTDIAQRAGVSRPTVYRAYADMTTLFADLMTREWTDVIATVVATVDQTRSWPDRIASEVVDMVVALRGNELFQRAVDLDPEWLLPYLLTRRGRSQELIIGLLQARLIEAQDAGAIRAGEPAILARGIVLAAHGYALSIATMSDTPLPPATQASPRVPQELDHELAELVRRYLAP